MIRVSSIKCLISLGNKRLSNANNYAITGIDYNLDELAYIANDGPVEVKGLDGATDIPLAKKKSHQSDVVTEPPNKRQHSHLGKMTEHLFIGQCLDRGWIVSLPYDPASPYDVVVDNGNRLLKIQCKGNYGIKPEAGKYLIGLTAGNKLYSSKDVHFFACYVFDTNTWYLLPFEAVEGKRWFTVAIDNQQHQYLEAWELIATA
jgi:hypothetical protein